jgi:hypothetical protein
MSGATRNPTTANTVVSLFPYFPAAPFPVLIAASDNNGIYMKPITLNPTTLKFVRAAFEMDPGISSGQCSHLITLIRKGCAGATKSPDKTESVARIIRRIEVAARMSRSVRFVDKLAADGVLQKVKLPGRLRATGFRESEVAALIAGTLNQ